MTDIISKLPVVKGKYRQQANLARMCWFQVGGEVDVLFQPADIEDLRFFMANLPEGIPYFVFGVGSNIIIRDEGFRGVAIRLGREFNYISINGTEVTAGASMLDLNFALSCAENNIAGLEFLSGVPGTIGGALAMNAGAYGTETSDVLISAKAVSRNGELRVFAKDEIGYVYRGKGLDPSWIFVEGVFQGVQGNSKEIAARIAEIQTQRASTQPIKSRTGGSTFKNPANMSAWKLIDQAGCRGLTIGGAQVSELHCNFFINTGTATATDLIALIAEVKDRVEKATGVVLETEIKVI